MSLRTRTLIILGVSLGLSALVLVMGFSYLFNKQFSQLENRDVKEHVQRVELAIENIASQLASTTADWALWQDTYEFIKDKNKKYIKSNITFEILSALGVTHLVYRDTNGSIIKSYIVDYEQENVNEMSAELRAEFTSINEIIPTLEIDSKKTGVIVVQNQSYIFASVPIFGDDRVGEARGSLTFSTILNEEIVSKIAKLTKLNTLFFDIHKASSYLRMFPELYEKILTSKNPVANVVNEQELSGYRSIRDIRGAPVGIIEVKLNRDITKQGKNAVEILVSGIIFIMLVTLIASGLSLNRWVLTRLSRLQGQVVSIDADNINNSRVTATGNDEITSLGSTINTFLHALEESQTSLILARQLADSANAAKSQFVAKVSHELRTPIAAITGINRIILKKLKSRAERELIELSDKSALGLLNIVNEILDLSKAESGNLTVEKIPYDLRQVARDTMEIIDGKIESNPNIELVCDISPEIPKELIGDPTKLKQILVNLLGNSAKFTTSGQLGLTVNIVKDNPAINLSVPMIELRAWDTGVGIADNKLQKIFEPYKQADETVERNYQGTGLGLAIVKQFTEALGGSVKVESELGKGTSFIVYVPFVQSEDKALVTNVNNSKVTILAPASVSVSVISKNLSLFGAQPELYNIEDASLITQSLTQLKNKELLVIFEQAFSNLELDKLITERLRAKTGRTIAVLSTRSVELREKLYHLGLEDVFSAPVLAEDILYPEQFRPEKNEHQKQVEKSAAEVAQHEEQAEPQQEVKSNGIRVLIADDAFTNRMILEDILRETGCEVVSVTNGQELLDQLMAGGEDSMNKPFDIILTDSSMPVLDGCDATKMIRDMEKLKGTGMHMPIVAVTAHAMEEELVKLRDAGVDGIISKPVRPEAVQEQFARLLGRENLPENL